MRIRSMATESGDGAKVPSSTDEPDKLDWKEIVRHAKAGQMMMTTGPLLEVQTE